MTKEDVKKGLSVLLNSGGPTMTIDEIIDDQTVKCYWFNNKVRNSDTFDISTLKLYVFSLNFY